MTQATEAANVVAEAAVLAAERVASAARSAVESAASAAMASNTAAQLLATVAASRIDGLEKQFSRHEDVCGERYKALGGWIKTTFFTMLGATGAMVFYLVTHR